MIRVVVADDEPPARSALRAMLAREPDVAVVAEAEDVASAARAALEHRPDVLFLDVRMPDGDGFEVVERIAGTHLPEIVFTTAHDEYALRAFDVHALDYVLKPLDPDRVARAVARARARLALGADRPPPDGLATLLSRIAVSERGRQVLVRFEDVRSITAAGNYATLAVEGAEHLVRVTLAELERRLDARRFARVHRSAIVNLERVRAVAPLGHGDHELVLDDGSRLRVGREYRERVLARLSS